MLTDRQKEILKIVIDNYIESAEPVGSHFVSESIEHKVSSATVRNEMSLLEDYGYLTKPHTSSGRVPTDKGYREYVDNLMEPNPLSKDERGEIKHELSSYVYRDGNLLKAANATLSDNTGLVTISLRPRARVNYIKQLRILFIEPGRALVVLVLSAGLVHDRIIRISDLLSAQDLEMLSQSLERAVQGLDIKDITFVAMQEVESSRNIDPAVFNQLLYEVYITIKQADELEVYIDGMHNLFLLPEFRESNKITGVYDALSKNGILVADLAETNMQEEQKFMVRIGQEIKIADLDSCSLISATYKTEDNLYGVLGLVGPKRMNYEKVLPKVSFMREVMKDN